MAAVHRWTRRAVGTPWLPCGVWSFCQRKGIGAWWHRFYYMSTTNLNDEVVDGLSSLAIGDDREAVCGVKCQKEDWR
jgi:hypothetical protein